MVYMFFYYKGKFCSKCGNSLENTICLASIERKFLGKKRKFFGLGKEFDNYHYSYKYFCCGDCIMNSVLGCANPRVYSRLHNFTNLGSPESHIRMVEQEFEQVYKALNDLSKR